MSKSSYSLLLILLVALLLRLPGLGQSLWLDELKTSNLALGGNVLLMKSLVMDTHPPVYFVFIGFWNRIFGDSELALRMPSLLFGLASIPLMYAVGSRLLSRKAGMLAAFVLAVSPVHIWYSTEARPYTANVLLVLAATLAFCRLAQTPRKRFATTGYFLCVFGLAFIHYYAVTCVIAFSAWAWWRHVPNARRIHVCNGVLVALVGGYFALKLSASPMRTEAHYLKPFSLLAWYKLYFQWFATGNGFNPVILPPELTEGAMASLRRVLAPVMQALTVLLFGLGSVSIARWHRESETPQSAAIGALLLACSIPVFLLVLPWIGLPQTYTERSALSVLPFFYLILIAGLCRFESAVAWRRVWSGTVLFALVTLLTHADLRGTWTVYKPHPDWRGAAAYLGRELDNGGRGRPLFSAYESPVVLSYYDARLQEESIQEPPVENLERLKGFVDGVFGTNGSIGQWLSQLVERNLEEYAELQASRWAGHEMIVYLLPGEIPGALRLKERTPDGIFYVLFHQVPGQAFYRAHPVFSAKEFEVMEEARFDSLILFKMKRRLIGDESPSRQ